MAKLMRACGPVVLLLAVACSGGEGGNQDTSVPDATLDLASDFSGMVDGTTDADSNTVDCASRISMDAQGLLVSSACLESQARLLPYVRIDGQWIGADDPSTCELQEDLLTCPAGEAGVVEAAVSQDHVRVSFRATEDIAVEGLALLGTARVDGATGWLSNGFQSWSQSGVVKLSGEPAPEALEAALAARGDAEVNRTGQELSWWYSWVGGQDDVLFAGAVTSQRFKPWVQVFLEGPTDLVLRLVSGAAGEKVFLVSGEVVEGETFRITLGSDLGLLAQDYAQSLPSRRWEHPVPAEAGWNSWYDLWDDVDQEALLANAALAGAALSPVLPAGAPPVRIVVDDGWQEMWGLWVANAKFPSGMKAVADGLHAEGQAAGIWMAPLLVDSDCELATDHPEWFLPNATFNHLGHGQMRILDVTRPEAGAHLSGLIQEVVSWGYDLLKLDFLFAGTFEDDRYVPATGMEAYVKAVQIIREAAGEVVHLLACGAPPLPSLPWFDSWRVGGDIAFEGLGPRWPFIVNQARMIASRWPLCLATLCDADPVLLRDLPEHEVNAGAWVVAFAGGALFLSDDLRDLPPENYAWGVLPELAAYSMSGLPVVPVDFFPTVPPKSLTQVTSDVVMGQNSHVLPFAWEFHDGRRVGLNPGEEPLNILGTAVPGHSVRELE